MVFAPFLVLAAESPVATEPAQAAQAAQSGQGIQAAADVASNFIEDIWSFFDDDLPEKKAIGFQTGFKNNAVIREGIAENSK